MKTAIKDIFFKQILNILKNSLILHSDLPFLPERMEMKINKSGKLYALRMIKKMLV